MKKENSPYCASVLAEGLPAVELPLTERSDNWWDLFWHYVGVAEAKRLMERVKK